MDGEWNLDECDGVAEVGIEAGAIARRATGSGLACLALALVAPAVSLLPPWPSPATLEMTLAAMPAASPAATPSATSGWGFAPKLNFIT